MDGLLVRVLDHGYCDGAEQMGRHGAQHRPDPTNHSYVCGDLDDVIEF
jgi:hypothetical protein